MSDLVSDQLPYEPKMYFMKQLTQSVWFNNWQITKFLKNPFST